MSKISNPAGAVRVLRSTMAKMVEEFKVQERRMKRLEAEVERKSKALTLAGADCREATWAAGHLAAAVKDAIHALTGSHIPTDDARELGANLLDFVRGAMKIIEQNNVEGAEQRERIRELETLRDQTIEALQRMEEKATPAPVEAGPFLRGEFRLMREYRPS